MLKKKIKYVDEWGLDKKTTRKVKKHLTNWMEEFVKRADGRLGSIEKSNFMDGDLFFFTDCADILSAKPESRAHEINKKITTRKKNVMFHLFLKELINGKPIYSHKKCSHCGFSPMDIEGVTEGYYRFCPKCGRIVIDAFAGTLVTSVNDILEQLEEREDAEEKKT